MMDQVPAECATGAASSRSLGDVVGWREKASVCTRFTYFNSLSCERVTPGRSVTRVNLRQQSGVDTTVAQVSQRSNGYGHASETSCDHLNGEAFIKVFASQAQGTSDFSLFMGIVNLIEYFKLA